MDLTIRLRRDRAGVDGASWDALDHGDSPFLEHGFLVALEASGSIGKDSGWDPFYLLAESEGRLVGAVAAFRKHHSYGEYIFDFPWARAAQRSGLDYYPKLVIAAPVTPATGRRMLLHPSLSAEARAQVERALVVAVRELADELDCSSVHWLFCSEHEQAQLREHGYMPRGSYQFHWHNAGYADFDAFLATLASRKRKQIRKERERARASLDGPLEFIAAADLSGADVAALDRFYRRTCDRHGGQDYLRPGFFHQLAEHLPQRMRLCRARRRGRTVAGALYLQTQTALFGRYWGFDEHIDLLHFEAAYYAGIEHAITCGLSRFEAGAQGEHKLLRGFAPVAIHSAHWIRHAGLRDGVRRFLEAEMRELPGYLEALGEYLPYRKDEAAPVEPAAQSEADPEPDPEPQD